jgi:hypothetical protein
MTALAFIALAWAAVIFYWIVAALSGFGQSPRTFTARFFSMFLIFIAFILMAGALRFPPFSNYLYALSWPIEILGLLFVYGGLGLAIYVRLGGEPLRFFKYPLYAALLIMFIGTALALGRVDAYIAVALVCFSFWLRVRAISRRSP